MESEFTPFWRVVQYLFTREECLRFHAQSERLCGAIESPQAYLQPIVIPATIRWVRVENVNARALKSSGHAPHIYGGATATATAKDRGSGDCGKAA